MIFDIQRFSTHDGKGIRTIIFLKGCPLRCPWCENPESRRFDYDIFYDVRQCIGCHECLKAVNDNQITLQDAGRDNSPIIIHRERITDPETLREVCPTGALTVVGEHKNITEIIAEIEKDLPFYKKSGGGLTLSGGEPFAQPEFMHELLMATKKKHIHTAVETCLVVPWSAVEKNLPYIDTLLADIKHTDRKKFKEYTGGDLDTVTDNLSLLAEHKANVTARVPVIPGFNNTQEEMASIIDFVAAFDTIDEVNFIPYHTLGKAKFALLGKTYDYHQKALDDDASLENYARMTGEKRLSANIGG